MKEQEINTKLITDLAKIMTISGYKIPEIKSTDFHGLVKEIAVALDKGHEQLFIDMLQNISNDYTQSVQGVLDLSYMNNTSILLQHRLDNKGCNEKIILPDFNDKRLTDEDIENINIALEKYEKTVIPYSALEYYNSLAALQRDLIERIGKPIMLSVQKRTNPIVYRTKETYLGHRIWSCTQIMPFIIVSITGAE